MTTKKEDSAPDHDETPRQDAATPAGPTPEAKRALAEADARRAKAALDAEQGDADPNKETGGPRGEEPTRYGDWERNGRAYDF